jgi:hypothetical protein
MALVAQSAYSLPMPPPYSVSRCSLGSPVMFRWFGFPSAPLGADLEVATDVFLRAVFPSRVEPGSHETAVVGSLFRHRIRKAMRGALRTPYETKAINPAYEPPLFEVRWQGLGSAQRLLAKGGKRFPALIRMYYSEPDSAPHHFIGHHIHEKTVTPGVDIRRLQNAEIDIALGFYYQGEQTTWGILS